MEIAELLTLVEGVVTLAVKEEPAVAASLQKIFSKPNPTPADWQAERDSIASETYEKLVPNTKLPPDSSS